MTQRRNERGRLRITGIDVTFHPQVATVDLSRIGRYLEIFEDFCVVTQRVRGGVDVQVKVHAAGVGASPLETVAVAT